MNSTCKGEIVASSPPDSEISLWSLSNCWIWSSMLLSKFCNIFSYILPSNSLLNASPVFLTSILTCCVVLNLVRTLSTSLSTAEHPSIPRQAGKWQKNTEMKSHILVYKQIPFESISSTIQSVLKQVAACILLDLSNWL